MGDKPVRNRLAQRDARPGAALGEVEDAARPPRLQVLLPIAWDRLEIASPADDEPDVVFSFLSTFAQRCGRSPAESRTTNARTPRDHHPEPCRASAMYGGHIEGVGPALLGPSIEAQGGGGSLDKPSHQIFFFDRGAVQRCWCIPTASPPSPPRECGRRRMSTPSSGWNRPRILQPGYPIEYDYVDPQRLRATLELPDHAGLFPCWADQRHHRLRGGGGAGPDRGLNAARHRSGDDAVILRRDEAYIGRAGR